MQVPRTSRGSLVKGRSQAKGVAQQAVNAHWQSIVKSLDSCLKIMKANYVRLKTLVSCICCSSSVVVHSHFLFSCFTGALFLGAQYIHTDILVYKCSAIQQVNCLVFIPFCESSQLDHLC